MADTAVELLTKLLTFFNEDNQIYKDLIGDASKSDNITAVDPDHVTVNEINRGAIGNVVEYLRRLRAFLIDGMDMQDAVGYSLLWWGLDAYGIDKPPGWTDADYKDFIVARILETNDGPVAISEFLKRYASTVQIIEGIDDGAFSDVSFSDCYVDFQAVATSTVTISGTIDLLTNYNIKVGMNGIAPITIDCRGGSPAATTLAEIITEINTAFNGAGGYGAPFAAVASNDGSDHLVLTAPITTGAYASVEFTPPASNDALNEIMGLSEAGSYDHRFQLVKAALAGASGGMPFFFRVILTGVAAGDYVNVVNAIEACRAAGVTYIVQAG